MRGKFIILLVSLTLLCMSCGKSATTGEAELSTSGAATDETTATSTDEVTTEETSTLKDYDLSEIDVSQISKVNMQNPGGYLIIEQEKDIKLILDQLQSMKLVKKKDDRLEIRAGFAIAFDIYLLDGSEIVIAILSDEIYVNGYIYSPDRNYAEDMCSLFDEMRTRYPFNNG